MNIETVIDIIRTLHALRSKFKPTTYIWDKESGYRMEVKLEDKNDRHLATFDLRSKKEVDNMYQWIANHEN